MSLCDLYLISSTTCELVRGPLLRHSSGTAPSPPMGTEAPSRPARLLSAFAPGLCGQGGSLRGLYSCTHRGTLPHKTTLNQELMGTPGPMTRLPSFRWLSCKAFCLPVLPEVTTVAFAASCLVLLPPSCLLPEIDAQINSVHLVLSQGWLSQEIP